MGDLTRYGSRVVSVFDLLGRNENDLTAALGFALARSPQLLAALLDQVGEPIDHRDLGGVSVALEVSDTEGRTDLEIELPEALVVVEAKVGWLLPKPAQLASYAPRIGLRRGGRLVTLSQASDAFAAMQLPQRIDGVKVVHLTWHRVRSAISDIGARARGRERIWLDELAHYLDGVMRVRSVGDSWTYCVALSEDRPGSGGARTFREYVTDVHRYFHPFGVGGWPTEPPNFLAFRWNSAVQLIHRVVGFEVVTSLLDRWPDIPQTADTARPHAVYKLGPRIPPFVAIPSGAQYRASRLWVLLDQLQTSPTLADALVRSDILDGGKAGWRIS